jgi:hypothetical protein
VTSGPGDFRRDETRRRLIVAQRFGQGLAKVSFEVLEAPNEPETQRIRAGGHNEVYGPNALAKGADWIAEDHVVRFPEELDELLGIGAMDETSVHALARIIEAVYAGPKATFSSHEISTAIMLWANEVPLTSGTGDPMAEPFAKELNKEFRRLKDRLWLPLPCLPRWDISAGAAITPYAIAKRIRAVILRTFGVLLDEQTIADFGFGFEHHQIVLKVAPLLQCIRAMERREAKP